MTEIRGLCLRHRVVIDIDHVIQHADRGANRATELIEVELAIFDMLGQVD